MQQCKWAKAKGGRLALTSEGQKLLASLDESRFSAGVEAFLWDDEFDELNRINHIRGQSGGGKRYPSPPSDRRRTIVGILLAQWPVNQWIAFDEAVRFLRATGRHFWGIQRLLHLVLRGASVWVAGRSRLRDQPAVPARVPVRMPGRARPDRRRLRVPPPPMAGVGRLVGYRRDLLL